MAQKIILDFFSTPASKKSTTEVQRIQEKHPDTDQLFARAYRPASFASETAMTCGNNPPEPTAPPCNAASTGGGFSTLAAFEEPFQPSNFVFPSGFGNWRKATAKFKEHERSKLHMDSVQRHAALGNVPINALLSDALAEQQGTARHVLELLFRSIRFLGSKGMPFRGDTTRDGILYELMLKRTYDLPKEREWVMRRDNWMSNTIQSEIIQQFAHAIQRDIVARSSESRFYGLTADGTTDVSTTEQFSSLFEPCEAVARGLQSSKASALGALECANVLKDRIAALRDDDIVEEMVHKVEACASEMDLKMPDDHRKSEQNPRPLSPNHGTRGSGAQCSNRDLATSVLPGC
ncbi:unnamed protein product [Leuciscus chuanchicus]